MTTPLRNPWPRAPRRPEWNQWVPVGGVWDMEAGVIRGATLLPMLTRQARTAPGYIKMLVPLDNIEGISWTYQGRAEFPQGVAPMAAREVRAHWGTFIAETTLDLLAVLREAVPFSWPRVEQRWWHLPRAGGGDTVDGLPVVEDMVMEGEWPRAPKTLAELRQTLGTVPRKVERGRLVEVGPAERIWAYWRRLARAQLLDLFDSDPVLITGDVRDTGGFISEAALDPWGLRPVVPRELLSRPGLVGPLP